MERRNAGRSGKEVALGIKSRKSRVWLKRRNEKNKEWSGRNKTILRCRWTQMGRRRKMRRRRKRGVGGVRKY